MANDSTATAGAPPVYVINGTSANSPFYVSVTNGYKGPESYGAHTTISTSGVSAQSSAITGSMVDIWADQDSYIAIGANPTASSSTYALPKNTIIRVPITSGNKVAALQISTGGTVHINVVG